MGFCFCLRMIPSMSRKEHPTWCVPGPPGAWPYLQLRDVCPAGTTSPGGTAVTCEPVTCKVNEKVEGRGCVRCADLRRVKKIHRKKYRSHFSTHIFPLPGTSLPAPPSKHACISVVMPCMLHNTRSAGNHYESPPVNAPP